MNFGIYLVSGSLIPARSGLLLGTNDIWGQVCLRWGVLRSIPGSPHPPTVMTPPEASKTLLSPWGQRRRGGRRASAMHERAPSADGETEPQRKQASIRVRTAGYQGRRRHRAGAIQATGIKAQTTTQLLRSGPRVSASPRNPSHGPLPWSRKRELSLGMAVGRDHGDKQSPAPIPVCEVGQAFHPLHAPVPHPCDGAVLPGGPPSEESHTTVKWTLSSVAPTQSGSSLSTIITVIKVVVGAAGGER